MKKIFFYAGLLAVATSCTNEIDTLDVQNENAAGISFKSAGVESRMMWDDNGSAYEPFWYAEMDRINVYGAGALSVGDPTNSPVAMGTQNKFSALAKSPAVYKATQSKKNGVFTSLEIASTLNYENDKEAVFFATYPTTVSATYKSGKNIELTDALPASEQTQKGLKGDNKAQVMYASTRSSRANSYDAVGETVDLNFVRPLKALVFTTANSDDYTKGTNSIFGELKSIEVETQGYNKDGEGELDTKAGDILPTALSYDEASFLVDTLTNAATITKTEAGQAINKITLNINEAWNDKALAIAAIIPNDRKEYATANEAWNVKFNFKNITLTHKMTEIPKGTKFNAYMPVPALDIQAYDYLVTNEPNRTLIVNGGKFTEIFSESQKVKWNGEEIDPADFQTIIVDSDVEMGDAAFALLNKFEAATSLTLKGVTELKKSALTGMVALTSVNLPLVNKVASGAFYDSHNLAEVIMPAFDFSTSKALTAEILKSNSLETLDMSGVASMKATFPNEGFTLDNFNKLSKVTVKEGLVVGASAFKNCTALKTIANAVELAGASAFEGSGIESIKLTNTVIPVNAFKNAKNLAEVTNAGGATLYPTEVQNGAFESATSLMYLDLSKTTYVGGNAFAGATSYLGAYYDATKNLSLLYVGANEVGASAFESTNVTYVEFTNLTVLTEKMLNVTGLKEVKFKEVIETPAKGDKLTDSPFGTVKEATLFLNPKQSTKFYTGNKFHYNGDADDANVAEFNKITFE